jgi:hypothetical protein
VVQYTGAERIEKVELFRKIEPYLTFLTIHQLERQGADIQSKVEELEELNQSLRNRDKMKDDAIAQLSDQLLDTYLQYYKNLRENTRCNNAK